jgi:hypothetical protein
MNAKRRPNIRKKYAILAVLFAIVCGGAVYAARVLSERELHKGRSMLESRDYDAAAGEFRRVAGSKKYHVKARGLLLYSLVMEGRERRPMQARTGVDSAGLLRLMALHNLAGGERVSRDHEVIRDLDARVDRSAAGVMKRLAAQGIETRGWDDAQNVFLWFARTAWQNLDPDTAAPGQPETRVLDFTAALIGMKGADRQVESRALRYLADRLAADDAPLDMAALVRSSAFQQLLEATALSGKQPQSARAREILRRQRFYEKLQQAATIGPALSSEQDIALAGAHPEAMRDALLARYPVFSQNAKVWEELSGWDFDPVTRFWSIAFSAPEQGPDIAWAYGAESGRSEFINWFFIFTDALQWELLRFDMGHEPQESYAVQAIPAVGFEYCAQARELALNVPDYDPSSGEFTDRWRPFALDAKARLLKAAGPPRDNACAVQSPTPH